MYDGNVLGASTAASGGTTVLLAVTGFESLAIIMGIAFIVLATTLALITKFKTKA